MKITTEFIMTGVLSFMSCIACADETPAVSSATYTTTVGGPGSYGQAYKTNIDYNFKYGLEAVNQLKPVYYVHNDASGKIKRIGFVEQDVKQIIPELAVSGDVLCGGWDSQLTAVLVSAIKELKTRVQKLEAENLQLMECFKELHRVTRVVPEKKK